MQLRMVNASLGDVDDVFAVYRACTAALLARGIPQWDLQYPDRKTAEDAAARDELFWLVDRDRRVGSVILNTLQPPEYAAVRWHYTEPAMVIHTLVIDPAQQGSGLGRAAVAACEGIARDRGFASIRLDAFPGNPAAIALYDRLGYEHRGEVQFGFKPPGHQHYAVYEKPLT